MVFDVSNTLVENPLGLTMHKTGGVSSANLHGIKRKPSNAAGCSSHQFHTQNIMYDILSIYRPECNVTL